VKVFVAGGGGAIGRPLVGQLAERGHEVVALSRSPAKAEALRALGAEIAIADALDREAVIEVVTRARPEIVIHQLSALSGMKSLRNFDREFALTNRLRTEGTDHLIEAARVAGVRRFIAQSYGNWNYERSGGPLKTEEDPFDPNPPANQARSIAAIRYLESAVLGADGIEGVALRYGNFYGPGNSISRDGEISQQVRKRRLPIIGDGAGIWSFTHVDDGAAAAVAAIERGEVGVYNVADDAPAPVAEWLPELARVLGAKPPHRVPVWLGRLAAGEVAVSMMTEIRGTSSAKAKRELGWEPRYPSYREGFRDGLA
jgi:nucleoside-diphosphate-sugar epimerase